MATKSFPAEGENGLSVADWALAYSSQDGIVNDYHTGGVSALNMTRNNATDEVTIWPGLVSVDGYVLNVESPTVLPCPPVTSGSKTYSIAARYDPALNVADGLGQADPLGPCRLIITDAALDTTGGKAYVILYAITRSASQVLTAAPVLDYRRWVGPVLTMPGYPAAPPAVGFGPWSRGTMIVQTAVKGYTDFAQISIRSVNVAGTALLWQNLTQPPAAAFPAAGGLVAQDTPAQIVRSGGMVQLRGTLRRSTGASLTTGADVLLGTLPVGSRPGTTERRVCYAGAGDGKVRAEILANGQVWIRAGSADADTVSFIDLGAFVFRAEN